MNKKGYLLIKNEEFVYSFVSVGKNGEIIKVIIFQKIEPLVFNLVLSDFDPYTQLLLDNVVSNNNDIAKIMATVVQAVVLFLNSNINGTVYLEANSIQKNLLYNRIFTSYYIQMNENYLIRGQIGEKVEDYQIGKIYNSFYICLK
ncbi:MAG: DUF6934 family protein [Cytophagales bacterium]